MKLIAPFWSSGLIPHSSRPAKGGRLTLSVREQHIRYVYAIVACTALFFVYVFIGGILGWKHGGGAIPMILFLPQLYGHGKQSQEQKGGAK